MSSRWPYQNRGRGGNRFFRGIGRGKNRSIALAFVPKLNRNIGKEEEEDKGDRAAVNEDDIVDETVLCVSYGNGLLGAAIYEQSGALIRVMNDISEDGEFEFVKKLIQTVKPTTILANGSQDLSLLNFFHRRYEQTHPPPTNDNSSESRSSDAVPRWDPTLFSDETEETTEQFEEEPDSDDEFSDVGRTKFVKLSNNFFKYTKAMTRFNELFNSEDDALSSEERQLIVKMRVDMEAVHMVKAFGALLFYLDDIRLGVETQPLNVRSPVKSIKTYVLGSTLEIDHNTFRALDIFPRDDTKKVNGKKASLISMMDRCKSAIGRKCLLKWFKSPTTDREVLRSRQRCIHYFIQECNVDLTLKIVKRLNHIKGLQHVFKKFQAGTSTFSDWDGFTETLTALSEIVEMIQETSIKKELMDDEVSLKDFTELLVIVKSIIDFDDSRNEGRVSVCTGVDRFLDDYKNTYKTLPDVLTAIAESEGVRLGIAGNCSCIYVPLIGYLLALPHDFPLSEHPQMTLVYRTEREIRVKNIMTERLEEDIGDIRLQIIDKETAIILRLKKMILRKRRKINKFLCLAAKVDVLISMAKVAAEMGWNCPSLVEESVLEATSLYHPLSALITTKEFVPNRVISGRSDTKVSIITGPNACGKSVYMKQIGILAFLAHIGSFVPARHAKIGPIDRIVTRMFTVDSVLDGMSTFARDVDQVAVALRKSTSNSLVIIDEFGKGTMTEVGLSLLASCLTHWIEKGFDKCPHLFVSSHFHALPKYIPVENNMVVFLTFRVERLAEGKINYLFKLVEGIVDCSFAMAVAKTEKVPIDVIGRACQIYAELKSGKPLRNIESKVLNDEGDDDILAIVDNILGGADFLTEVQKMAVDRHSENDGSHWESEQMSRKSIMDTIQTITEQLEKERSNRIDCQDQANDNDDVHEHMEYDQASSVPIEYMKEVCQQRLSLEEEADHWLSNLQPINMFRKPPKQDRGILKRNDTTNQTGNLSVSFAASRDHTNRAETPEITPKKKKDVQSLINQLRPVKKSIFAESETNERPMTPPSPILFSSEDEGDDEKEKEKNNETEPEFINKITPMMRRLSSNDSDNGKSSFDTISNATSTSHTTAIFSTPKLEEASRKLKMEILSVQTAASSGTKTNTPSISILPTTSRSGSQTSLKRQQESTPSFIKSNDLFNNRTPQAPTKSPFFKTPDNRSTGFRTSGFQSNKIAANSVTRTPQNGINSQSERNLTLRAGDFQGNTQELFLSSINYDSQKPSILNFSQSSPLFSSQAYGDFDVQNSSKRSISPSSRILSELIEERPGDMDVDYMRTPSPSPLFDSQISEFSFEPENQAFLNFDALFDRQDSMLEDVPVNEEVEDEFMKSFGIEESPASAIKRNNNDSTLFESEKSLMIDTQVFRDSRESPSVRSRSFM